MSVAVLMDDSGVQDRGEEHESEKLREKLARLRSSMK